MPTTEPGRILIKRYLKEHNISITDLATLFGMKKQDVSSYLSGYKKTTEQTKFILTVIKHFRIRKENDNE